MNFTQFDVLRKSGVPAAAVALNTPEVSAELRHCAKRAVLEFTNVRNCLTS